MVKSNKIIVCCSQGVTGGPELLHQLVDALRSNGHNAFISYYPFEQPFQCPNIYSKYDSPQTAFSDTPGTFIVAPESATWILKKLKHAQAAVWWLSVDNYFNIKHQSFLRDFIVRYKSLVHQRLPLHRLRKFEHFVQSAYAAKFLEKSGISSVPLTDYLSSEHFLQRDMVTPRKNIVVYNPKKGQKQTLKLREAHSDIDFVPIQNMTPSQVADLFASAKIYIDFGHHPGKDRLPREAAMAGCCVITGRHGSARYFDDVSIPDEYKLDDLSETYRTAFYPLVTAIFNDYSSHSKRFDAYRMKIIEEPKVFQEQVQAIFDCEG